MIGILLRNRKRNVQLLEGTIRGRATLMAHSPDQHTGSAAEGLRYGLNASIIVAMASKLG